MNKNLTEYVKISDESNNTDCDAKILPWFLDISFFFKKALKIEYLKNYYSRAEITWPVSPTHFFLFFFYWHRFHVYNFMLINLSKKMKEKLQSFLTKKMREANDIGVVISFNFLEEGQFSQIQKKQSYIFHSMLINLTISLLN